jgi:hypothetical protein
MQEEDMRSSLAMGVLALSLIHASAYCKIDAVELDPIVPPLCLQQAQTSFGQTAEGMVDPLARELLHRVDIDQRCQMVLANVKTNERQALWPLIKDGMEEIYRRNALWLRGKPKRMKLFDQKTAGDVTSTAAWLVLQHADFDEKWQRSVITRLQDLAKRGRFQKDHLALLIDRVAVNSGQPQIYGSQGKCGADGLWHPKPIADPDHVEDRRKEVGLMPMADNIKRFVCG